MYKNADTGVLKRFKTILIYFNIWNINADNIKAYSFLYNAKKTKQKNCYNFKILLVIMFNPSIIVVEGQQNNFFLRK